jgi:hypothetical protein
LNLQILSGLRLKSRLEPENNVQRRRNLISSNSKQINGSFVSFETLRMDFKFFISGRPILLVILVTFFANCTNNSNDEIFKALDENLVQSNVTITASCQRLYYSLQGKLSEPVTAEKAASWYPKAERVGKLSKDIINAIEYIKATLEKESSLAPEVTGDLFLRLKNYKTELLKVDSQLTREFDKSIYLVDKKTDAAIINQRGFIRFFDQLSHDAVLAMLSKLQNNVKFTENRMISFCDNKVGATIDFYEVYSTIVTQNTSYLKAGDELIVSAGVGAFTKAAMPEITINNKKINVEYDGVANYKLRVPNKVGKHTVPVQISFTDEVGKKQTITRPVTYTVIE